MARLSREYIFQMLAFGVAISDRLIVPAILLRRLGVGGFAGWAVAMAYVGFVSSLDFGTNRYFTNQLLNQRVKGETDAAVRSFRQGTILVIGLTSLGSAFFAIMLYVAPPRTGDAAVDTRMLAIILPLLLATWLQQTIAMRLALYRAHQQFARETAIRAATDIVRIAVIAAAAIAGAELEILALAWLAVMVLGQFIPVVIDTARRFPAFRERPVPITRDEWRQILLMSPGYFLQTFLTTMGSSLPIVALGYWVTTPLMVAQFGLMRTIANVARQVLQLFANVFGLELARRQAVGDDQGFAQVFFETNRFTGVQAAVVTVALMVFGQQLFDLWTARPGLFSHWMLLLAVVPPILLPSMMLSIEALGYMGRPWAVVGARAAQFAFTAVLLFVLPIASPAMSMMAALAIAEVIGLGLPLLWSIRQSNSRITVVGQLRLLTTTLLAAAVTAVILVPVALWPFASPWMTLALGTVLAAIAMAISLTFFGLEDQRRKILINLAKSRLRR